MDERLEELKQNLVLLSHRVRFFIVTDYQRLVAYDRRVDDSLDIDFADLKSSYDFFLPLTGQYEKPLAYSTHPADSKACERMGRLYDAIRELNHYEADGLHNLNVFLTRLLFCFYAEDTNIFPIQGQMTAALEAMTSKDGSDLPDFFEKLFTALDLPEDDPGRQDLPATLRAFPYVNGGLFSEKTPVPHFNARARRVLIESGRLSWSDISPVIFGSMFQSVMDPELRHELGAHYTSEKNIFKVIGPLFLDDLRRELDEILEIKTKSLRLRKLRDYQAKLASLKVADPACGCGNFLVVAFRELKLLELKAVEGILNCEQQADRSLFSDWTQQYSRVSINQFYGIEIEEFPADIARVSMWLISHVMNQRFGQLLGTVAPSIPLRATAHIACRNALECDWGEVFPGRAVNYLIGNPPYRGASTVTQYQKTEILSIFKGTPNAGILDYVCCWFRKAADLMAVNPGLECAFVSTNSICQGEQVAPLWGPLFKEGIHIGFAHQTFQWRNEAKSNAGVYCVVIGFGKRDRARKLLFKYEKPQSEPTMHVVQRINAYLLEANESVFVKSAASSLSATTPMVYGNKPTDGGNLIIEAADYPQFEAIEALRPYVKKLVGSRELLHNLPRYCLWLPEAPKEVLEIPIVAERIERCRTMRLSSRDPGCRKLAARAHEFRDLNNPDTLIAIPGVSSERREYVPMGFFSIDTIATNLCHIIPHGTLYDFGILESRLHMTWMRAVCGRLKSDYRYSRDLCYNTFPWPEAAESQRQIIQNLARNVLMARELYPELTLADLYDPEKMPDDLRRAHRELDLAVERLYRKKPFEDDEDRLQHLFSRYELLVKGEDASRLFSEG